MQYSDHLTISSEVIGVRREQELEMMEQSMFAQDLVLLTSRHFYRQRIHKVISKHSILSGKSALCENKLITWSEDPCCIAAGPS